MGTHTYAHTHTQLYTHSHTIIQTHTHINLIHPFTKNISAINCIQKYLAKNWRGLKTIYLTKNND